MSSKDFNDLPFCLGVGIVRDGTVVLSSLLLDLGLELLGPPLVRA